MLGPPINARKRNGFHWYFFGTCTNTWREKHGALLVILPKKHMKLPANSASNWFKWAPRKERLLAAELIAQSLEQVDISEGELRKAGLGTQL